MDDKVTQSIPEELKQFRFFANIDELQDIVTRGVEEGVANALKKYANEKFYVFGIDIPSDLGALYVGGNTEENYARIVEKNEVSERDKPYYRWCWHEWGAYEVLEPQPLMKLTWAWVHEHDECMQIEDERIADLYFCHQERVMLQNAINALKVIDNLGMFGVGAKRDEVLLYASVENSCDDVFSQSVAVLNPKSITPTLWPY